jgi:hypothetical protein
MNHLVFLAWSLYVEADIISEISSFTSYES